VIIVGTAHNTSVVSGGGGVRGGYPERAQVIRQQRYQHGGERMHGQVEQVVGQRPQPV
jgi:hypothetical protein